MTRFNYKNKPKNKGFVDIYGIHSVNAALKNTKRQHQKLVINHANRRIVTEKVEKLVKDIVELSNKEMFKLYGSEHNHQGIVLTTSSLIQPSLERILFESKNKKIEVILMLDQVTDPNNIGSIMRSCSLFNCNTIIVSKNNAPDITPSMTKTASGALEIVNYLRVTNLSRTILNFKKNNFWIYGFDNNKNNYSNNIEIEKKCLFVFGSEGKGLRKLTTKDCDEIISIKTNQILNLGIDSLNVSNACSIALYEHFKKYYK